MVCGVMCRAALCDVMRGVLQHHNLVCVVCHFMVFCFHVLVCFFFFCRVLCVVPP